MINKNDCSEKLIIKSDEAFNILGLSRSTVYRLMKTENFPKRIKIDGRQNGFRYSDLINWLDKTDVREILRSHAN
jgi:predicted DNA-binding transcriptional regulator AlpA